MFRWVPVHAGRCGIGAQTVHPAPVVYELDLQVIVSPAAMATFTGLLLSSNLVVPVEVNVR
jgi:hypothetical protein